MSVFFLNCIFVKIMNFLAHRTATKLFVGSNSLNAMLYVSLNSSSDSQNFGFLIENWLKTAAEVGLFNW